jgi:hypothetical protein
MLNNSKTVLCGKPAGSLLERWKKVSSHRTTGLFRVRQEVKTLQTKRINYRKSLLPFASRANSSVAGVLGTGRTWSFCGSGCAIASLNHS